MTTNATMPVSQQPLLNYAILRKTNRILANFVHRSAPLYGFSTDFTFLKTCYPLMTFIESVIYVADKEIEAAQRGDTPFTGEEPWLNRQAIIVALLQELELYDPVLQQVLDNITEYARLENQMMYAQQVTPEGVARAIELRCCDIVFLHYLCHRLLNLPYDDATLTALAVFEAWGDLETDLEEYQDDVQENNYNSYRMLIRLYGKDAPLHMQMALEQYQQHWQTCVAATNEAVQPQLHGMLTALRERTPVPPIPEPVLETWA